MPLQHGRRLRELDVAVVDDLDAVSPRIAEVEPAAGQDLDARPPRGPPHRLLVVDDQPEMAIVVAAWARPSLSARNWSPMSRNAMPRRPSAELEGEEPAVERERLLEIADLERDVVDARAGPGRSAGSSGCTCG